MLYYKYMDIEKYQPKLKELKKLAEDNGTTVIQESLNMHRNKLEKISDMAVDKIENEIGTATITEAVKVYDTTRKHLNTLDGRQSSESSIIAILPGEIAQRFSLDDEIKKQTCIEGEVARKD